MKFFEREPTHEDLLRQEAAGIADLLMSSNNNSFEDDDSDPYFESAVMERVSEITNMSVDDLLADAADDLARAELDEEGNSLYFATRAAAVGSRAIALILIQQNQQPNRD